MVAVAWGMMSTRSSIAGGHWEITVLLGALSGALLAACSPPPDAQWRRWGHFTALALVVGIANTWASRAIFVHSGLPAEYSFMCGYSLREHLWSSRLTWVFIFAFLGPVLRAQTIFRTVSLWIAARLIGFGLALILGGYLSFVG